MGAYFDLPGAVYTIVSFYRDRFGYLLPTDMTQDFDVAFQKIWGNFITMNDPSISNAIADGQSTGNMSMNAASAWPPYSIPTPYQLDLNVSFGDAAILKTMLESNS